MAEAQPILYWAKMKHWTHLPEGYPENHSELTVQQNSSDLKREKKVIGEMWKAALNTSTPTSAAMSII